MSSGGQLGTPTSEFGLLVLGQQPSGPNLITPAVAFTGELGSRNSQPQALQLGLAPFGTVVPSALTGLFGTPNSTLGFGTMMPGGPSSDIGLSQVRQVENLRNSPAGQTGYATGSSGNAYGAALDASQPSGNDEPTRPAKRYSPLSATGTGSVNDSRGDPYVTPKSTPDAHDSPSLSEQQRPTTRKP